MTSWWTRRLVSFIYTIPFLFTPFRFTLLFFRQMESRTRITLFWCFLLTWNRDALTENICKCYSISVSVVWITHCKFHTRMSFCPLVYAQRNCRSAYQLDVSKKKHQRHMPELNFSIISDHVTKLITIIMCLSRKHFFHHVSEINLQYLTNAGLNNYWKVLCWKLQRTKYIFTLSLQTRAELWTVWRVFLHLLCLTAGST